MDTTTSLAAFESLRVFDVDYAYLDSGTPPSPNYATWVFLHGIGFNGAVFEKLLPLAPAHNLRIVSVYRRGYPPSSGFRDEELAGIGFQKKIDDVESFFRTQATELAAFLVRFATEQHIPLAGPDGPAGGIALIGWSFGGVHATAVLAYLDELPEDTRSTLRKYLHTIVCHDPSSPTLGIPDPDDQTGNVGLLVADDRMRFDAFFDWVTAYYVHKSVTSENIGDLEFNNPSSELPHSMCALSHAQRTAYTSLEAFSSAGCDGKLLLCDTPAFAVLTKRALFDKARAEKSPDVRVRYMSSGMTPGWLVWALWMLRKYTDNPPEELYGKGAERARDIKFVMQTEGNHFVFWDDPEKAIQQYSVAIHL